jgi:hypothetical protein
VSIEPPLTFALVSQTSREGDESDKSGELRLSRRPPSWLVALRYRFGVLIVGDGSCKGLIIGAGASLKGERTVVGWKALAVCDEVGWVITGEGDAPWLLIATTSPAIRMTVASVAMRIRNRRVEARGTLRCCDGSHS